MKCPNCGEDDNRCVDTRTYPNNRIWRRRKCLSCGKRFTTYEVYVPDGEQPDAKKFRASNEEFARYRHGLKGEDTSKA